MAPNIRNVAAPGRRTVCRMCGVSAVRCPMEVTVEEFGGRGIALSDGYIIHEVLKQEA